MRNKDWYRVPGCPECEGDGERPCEDCGCCEVECEACDGTGYDDEEIDVTSFKEACRALGNGSHDYREDQGGGKFRTVGRQSADGTKVVKARDFRWEGDEDDDDEPVAEPVEDHGPAYMPNQIQLPLPTEER